MNTATPLLIALCGVAACEASAAEPCTPLSSSDPQARPSFTKERATVEDVLSTIEGGYRSRAYIVTWHGFRVLVSDPLAESNKSKGDSIDFIAGRYDVNGNRTLAFISTEQQPHQSAGASGSSSLAVLPATSTETGTARTESGVVEEVLRARDNGFRFDAYIVRSQEQRVAVSDPLALSHHTIGEPIDYLALRTASPGGRFLNFQVILSATEKASISKPFCGIPPTRETGVVDQALFTNAGGYKYRAYVVEWRGSKVVIDDPSATTNYQPGDSVSFWAARFEAPPLNDDKYQRFTFNRPAQTTAVNQPLDLQTSIAMDSAPVQAVLASDVDGYRSVAYLVNWHNTPIAIIDAFATTHFAAGDRITFSVARAAAPNTRELSFMLFAFPTHPCVKSQSSSDDSTAAATDKTPPGDCHS